MNVTLVGSTPDEAGINATFNAEDIAKITDPVLFFAIFGSHPPLSSLPASQQLSTYSQFAALVEGGEATTLAPTPVVEP